MAAWLIPFDKPSYEYEKLQHAEATVALAGWFRMSNEGASTALVNIPDGVLVLPGTQPLVSVAALQGTPRPDRPQQLALPPGDARVLLVEARRTVAEIAAIAKPGEALELPVRITVGDTFADGVTDTTDLLIKGDILGDSDSKSKWLILDGVSTVRVTPTSRIYRAER